ncbi:PKD domain-containing protein [Ferruginibacter sp.]
MKKYVLLIILSIVCLQDIYAAHTKGGWMYYQYLGPGINDPSKLRYKIGLNLYILCGSNTVESSWDFTFFSAKAPYPQLQNLSVPLISQITVNGCNTTNCYPCLSPVPDRCYQIINYETIVELDPSTEGYIVTKQRCCRIINIANLVAPSNSWGETFTIKIPGSTSTLEPTAPFNASPNFIFNDTAVVCGGNPFSLDFGATDIDKDSLVYSFIDAYDGSNTSSPNWPNTTPADTPPYNNVPYSAPYTGPQPLGALVTIDPKTGVVSGIAPPPGEYVICVLVKEYRNNIYIGESRKELHLITAFCNPLKANPNFAPVTCDGFTVTFNESSTGNPNTFYWDFGDPASGAANTSTLQFPTHTFTTAGIFDIKLKVSASGQCIDSIIKPLSVFPGFSPGFTNPSILCTNLPVQFTDTTKTAYGFVNSWRWDFGDLTTLADTSHLQNPSYTYPAAGTYTITLTVTNSKGCEKTIFIPITIADPPVVDVFPADTIYCGLDSIQLTGTGTGSFNWTPNTNIIGANTATPTVFPTVSTKYYGILTNAAGCSSRDSVTVTPKFDLTNAFTGPSPICEEDTVTLTGTSNYSTVTWQWSPATTVESPASSVTRVFPVVTTNYTLTTTWGKHCVVTANKIIAVKPLAIPNAGPSPAICNGQQLSAQLNASGGDTYTWTPATGLSDPKIANPVASPAVTTIYTVAVGVNGCSKTRNDSLIVTVKDPPPLASINDTLICNIDTLQLTTTGSGSYVWGPNYMISNINAQSPMVSPDVPTKYYVKLTDGFGCYNTDTVFVDVKDHVTLFAGNDTTVCRNDGVLLGTVSDALHYKWTPATYLNYDTIKHPYALPLVTTPYHVIANIGKCQSQDDVVITVVPYPAANAGPDTAICPGFSTQLSATGGSSYLWTPSTFLSNRNIANPVSIRPTASIRYIVAVTDTLGCPKPVRDTVWVTVYPKVVANAGPRDTSVVLGQPLQLSATGGVKYMWDPPTWLNNPLIRTPVALPQTDIRYVVTATSAGGCIGSDSIQVHLFKFDPDIYVPNAFTPNGDGLNDILKPILIGMKELGYFRVYNRFGNMVYSTTDIGQGWDGTYLGKGQDPATFVWMAEGITYKGDKRFKKGSVILIRQ